MGEDFKEGLIMGACIGIGGFILGVKVLEKILMIHESKKLEKWKKEQQKQEKEKE